MIVLDASAAIALLLDTQPHAARLQERLASPGEAFHAPHLIDLEVAQTLRRYVLRGDFYPERAAIALDDLTALGIQHHSHSMFLPRIWHLRDNMTAYDAMYVALAEALDAPLVTLDRRLHAAAGTHATIELF